MQARISSCDVMVLAHMMLLVYVDIEFDVWNLGSAYIMYCMKNSYTWDALGMYFF